MAFFFILFKCHKVSFKIQIISAFELVVFECDTTWLWKIQSTQTAERKNFYYYLLATLRKTRTNIPAFKRHKRNGFLKV